MSESRKRLGKIGTVQGLKDLMERYELFSTVPGRESLRIDNTSLPVEVAVARILAGIKGQGSGAGE